jgi:hypothetical protein
MAAWPGTLPDLWSADGFEEQDADNVIVSPNEVGPPKRRRRSTAAMRTVRAGIDLTEAEYVIMRSFYESDCAHGAVSFTKDDAHGTERTFYFKRPPRYAYTGFNWWRVELELEERY